MSEKTDKKEKVVRFGRETFAWLLAASLIGLLVVIGLYKHESIRSDIQREGELPTMATNYRFVVMVKGDTGDVGELMENAKSVASAIGVEMSTHLELSGLNELNRPETQGPVSVSPQTMEVLRASREIYSQTDGAFDVTVLPIIKLYRRGAETGQTPTEDEIQTARDESRWEYFELLDDDTVFKVRDSAGVDLGGIAKGYAIDKALEVFRQGGVAGAMVEIGGDLRVFGAGPGGKKWPVRIQDPFQPEDAEAMLCRLEISDMAVATSGNYHRAYKIGNIRYSHIIDPRDPRRRQADEFPASVTVVAPTAMVADAWATALSVLAGRGQVDAAMALLDQAEGVEALLVFGSADKPRVIPSRGFSQYFLDAPTKGLETLDPVVTMRD